MINVTGHRNRLRIVNSINRRLVSYENAMYNDVRKVLVKQYNAAITTLRSMSLDTDGSVDEHKRDMIRVLRENYLKVAIAFGKLALEEADTAKTKGPFEDYMNSIRNNINILAAEQVVNINKTTKNAIKRLVKKGFDEGMTNAQIAKKISKSKDIATMARAKMIARTETHGMANRALRESMTQTGVIKFKEWVSVKDDRTRVGKFNHLSDYPAGPNGESVAMEESFQGTGEALMEPGDPSGSPGNVINCRCGQLFHTRPNAVIE